ncbi:protein of unknown function [Methylotuvimicrobium alcaliphilum 20Z]|uniref:Uncharacterized protein n=1 Tax=Methylotuvimicrobium alcaliphilum (strain DSM 19304 / NCIMB 14124 / VKM B-2133 / 20Z) TaxID=1091494 RepID=G4SZ88_META2|nr:protein of unknown function [Methylotuvimicrobium alcaliphilum 20Z]
MALLFDAYREVSGRLRLEPAVDAYREVSGRLRLEPAVESKALKQTVSRIVIILPH